MKNLIFLTLFLLSFVACNPDNEVQVNNDPLDIEGAEFIYYPVVRGNPEKVGFFVL